MKIAISEIKVQEADRIRKDIGDLDVLQTSIATVGLINPVLIDEENNLIAGYRRLTACKNLGWTDIETTVVTLHGDKIKMLDVEIAENFFRKDFTPEEILATEKRRQEILDSLKEEQEKGVFQKFWSWLKSFFLPQPHTTEESKDDTAQQQPDSAGDKAEEESVPVHQSTENKDESTGGASPAEKIEQNK